MTTPGTIPVVVAESTELIQRVHRLTDRLDAEAAQVASNARRAARLLPGALASQLDDLCSQLLALVEECQADLRSLLAMAGSPGRLWHAGATWVERFNRPVSAGASEMDAVHLAAPFRWDGTAGPAYAATIERQRRAVTALAAIGPDLNSALSNAAVAIVAMWAAIAAALLMTLADIIVAAVAAGTGFAAPAAVGLALQALAALTTGLVVGVGGFMLVVERINDAMVAVRGRLNERNDVGDEWPRTAAARFNEIREWGSPA